LALTHNTLKAAATNL